jgi:hypothetical protein
MWRSRETELPFPHLSEVFLGAGRDPLSRPRRLLARRREVLTAAPSPPKIAVRGMGADL